MFGPRKITLGSPSLNPIVARDALVKPYINVTSSTYDTLLDIMIAAAQEQAESYCQRFFSSRTVTEKIRDELASRHLVLVHTPIISVTSIVDQATTTVKVFIASWGYGTNMGTNPTIPWNPKWEPASGNDMEMIILDRATGKEWGLWGVQKVNWSTCLTLDNLLKGYRGGTDLCVANAIVGKNPDGTYSDAVRSTGFTQTNTRGLGKMNDMAMLPTLDEIEKGSINHVVNMETYGTMFGPACTSSQLGTAAQGVDCGYAVAPANRLEWVNGPATNCGTAALQNTAADRQTTVPEGMRFALNLTDAQIDAWLDSRGYTGAKRSTARIFAVAMRDYGWVISDTTCWDSSMAVEGVGNPKARPRWSALGITNPTVDGTTLLDGLITSADQVRTIKAPSSNRVVNPW